MKVNNLNKLLVKFNLTMKKKLQSIELMISKEKLIKIYKIYQKTSKPINQYNPLKNY